MCFLIENQLFTGDTILKRRVGRIDLPGGDPAALSDSLRKLSLLPPELEIYPGHGEPSTMLDELVENYELAEAIR